MGYETILLVNDRFFEACFEACQGVYIYCLPCLHLHPGLATTVRAALAWPPGQASNGGTPVRDGRTGRDRCKQGA